MKDKLAVKNINVPRNKGISPDILMRVIIREKLTSKRNNLKEMQGGRKRKTDNNKQNKSSQKEEQSEWDQSVNMGAKSNHVGVISLV